MATSVIILILIGAGLVLYAVWLVWTSAHGAPYVAIEMDVVERALEMARFGEDDAVYDLGSGDGRIPIMAALQHKAQAVGVELDFLRYLYSVLRVQMLRLGNQVRFLHQNIFETDLSEATVITMYLLQATNERLMKKFVAELRPGTRIVSAALTFPGWKPTIVDGEYSTPYGPLYLYEIGVSNLKNP